ncbi:MAG: metallophosphoesterase [Methanomicrobiales archaeon]|nr:metallophosphoesterase [Methanomicrobiales archaeon]
MRFEFLSEGPALVIENQIRVVVIADLHFGIEAELSRKGFHFPSQSRQRVARACTCIEKADADCLILLGDVKHNVPLTSRQEYREIPAILDTFRDLLPFKVTPGNHDGGIERFLTTDEILPIRGGVIDGVWYLHGHTYPNPASHGGYLVAGHYHPMIALYDEVGCALYDRAYLSGTLDTGCFKGETAEASRDTHLLLMPSFNELTGCDILHLKDSNLGPLSRCLQMDAAEVFLTDGTYVGTVGSLSDARP